MKWPQSFYELRRGQGCPACAEGRPDETPRGVRFFAGAVSDAYLNRANIQRGYTIVVWRGRHVAEPTAHLHPVKTNYNVLGNSLPHLHTHLIPRYEDDPRPGWPFPFPEADSEPIDEQVLQGDVAALRKLCRT